MLTRRSLTKAACTFASVALAAAVAACGASGGGQPADMITVSDNQCGGTWHVASPGWHTFQIRNQGVNGAEIDLTDPATGAVYAELENYRSQAPSTPMRLNVGSGKYAFLCLFVGLQPACSAPRSPWPGTRRAPPAVLPVTYNDLIPVAKNTRR